jgi:dihydropteroate synthase
VIKSISKKFPEAIISIDTFRSSIAKAAVEAGARMVNDISGGTLDKKMFGMIASLNVPYVLMHTRGTPKDMKNQTNYENLIKDIIDFFHEKIFQLHALGVKDIVADPGLGFAKTVDQNFQILHHLGQFQVLERPIMVGISRKSMIWKTLNTNPEGALNGTTALNAVALLNGASILRVHDAQEAKEVIHLIQKMNLAGKKSTYEET